MEKRIEEGRYLLDNAVPGQYNHEAIIKKFDELRSGIDDDYFWRAEENSLKALLYLVHEQVCPLEDYCLSNENYQLSYCTTLILTATDFV